MLDRDREHLAALGILIERNTSSPQFRLRGSMPIFTPDELRVLAIIRDTFDTRHPQAAQICEILTRLTADLTTIIYSRSINGEWYTAHRCVRQSRGGLNIRMHVSRWAKHSGDCCHHGAVLARFTHLGSAAALVWVWMTGADAEPR